VTDSEELLPGGNLGGAVRVGDTVRRRTGPWTPAVHALLRHLEAAGFPESPRVLGIDDQGREILTFIEGAGAEPQPWPAWARSDDALAQMGDLLRRLHEAVGSFRSPAGAVWRFTGRAPGAGEIVCHNDVGPYNVVWRDGRIVGLIDWDVAGPAPPFDDLAFAAWQWIPLHDPSVLDPGWEQSPDLGRRIRLLCDAYGLGAGERSTLLEAIPARMRASLERMSGAADAGEPAFVRVRKAGHLDDISKSIVHVERAVLPGLRSGLERRA
jgi:Phosphotransferase enzyme family